VSDLRDAPRPRRDSGFSLIEILIAVVLLGGVIAGTMAALRATTMSGALHRDHSRAHQWLQSASDILYAQDKEACDASEADKGEQRIRDAYNLVVDDEVQNPTGWADWQIEVIEPVKFWNAGNLDADPDPEFFFGSDCDPSLQLQLVTLEVRAQSGRIIERVEIVK
jgi:prepilin-type N-terminal cleavage/methylation domain-containing protein